ncbi:MAG: HD domain-containing protein [Alphaproteobacteria bacterium]|nr:HD domain-containing protein [Alphaproteobacteria bacterium]
MGQKLHRILSFFYEIGTARRRPRAWEQAIGAPMANVAEHTMRTQVLAAYLAVQEGGDPKQAIWIALWHDAGEIRGADATPHQKPYVEVHEAKALAATIKGVDGLGPLIETAYTTYKARQSIEAQCVKDADILDTVIELMEAKANGHGYPQHPLVAEQIRIKRERYFTATARTLHDALMAEDAPSPWDWFLLSESSFQDGTYGR